MYDLTGQRFGKLVVVKLDHTDKKRGRWWLCKCDCGNTKLATSHYLIDGTTTHCGCWKGNTIDLTGKRFGKLLVVKRVDNQRSKDGKSVVMWECKCDCGNTYVTSSVNLMHRGYRSCGCSKELLVKDKNGNNVNVTKTRLYQIYHMMKMRCYCKTNEKYSRYGGRGIKICNEWLGENGFLIFYDWSMKNGYDDSLTIDRIDNDGDYEPSNCRWATQKEQANNKSNNRYYEIDGIKKTLTEWCRICHVKYYTASYRLDKQGKTIREALGLQEDSCVYLIPKNPIT